MAATNGVNGNHQKGVVIDFPSVISAKLDDAEKYKEKGNELYKMGDYKKAAGQYHRAVLYIKGIDANMNSEGMTGLMLPGGERPNTFDNPRGSGRDLNPDILARYKKVTTSVYNNLSATLLKMEDSSVDPNKIQGYLEKVIEACEENEIQTLVKAKYRLGLVALRKKEPRKALEIFDSAIQLNGGKATPEILAGFKEAKEMSAQQLQSEKNLFKNMLSS